MASPEGVEPSTAGFVNQSSIQLSYEDMMVPPGGFEPPYPLKGAGLSNQCVCRVFRHGGIKN